MEQQQTKTSMFIWLILLSIIGFLFWLANIFFTAFSNSPDGVKAAISAGLIAVTGTVVSMLYNANAQKKREIESHLRSKKSEAYEFFIITLTEVLKTVKTSEPVDEEKLQKDMFDLVGKLVVWGSDDVVGSFLKWRYMSSLNTENPEAQLFQLEKMLLSIRTDLGHKNKNLSELDLVRLFINDLSVQDKKYR